MPHSSTSYGPSVLFQLTEFALGCGMVLGLLLVLAGASDTDPSVSRPWAVQLLPLSGFVVVGATVVGIRTIRLPTSASRRSGAKLIGIAVALIVVAAWIALAASAGRGLESFLVIAALPPFVAGLVSVVQTGPRKEAV